MRVEVALAFLCVLRCDVSSEGNNDDHVTKSKFKKWVDDHYDELTKEYHPHHGYEPYWPGGEWLFHDIPLPDNQTTTKAPTVCGEECNYLYKRIGKVCGRKTSFLDYYDYSKGFQTFDSYCKFLDAQCRSTFEDYWMLVHEGPCSHKVDSYFKPMHPPEKLKQRLTPYFKDLAYNYKTASLDYPLRKGRTKSLIDLPKTYLERPPYNF